MNTKEKIEKELKELINEEPSLRNLAKDYNNMVDFGYQYQSWYTRAIKLTELLGPDRLEEFIGHYRIDTKRKDINAVTYVIQDYINGKIAPKNSLLQPMWNIHHVIIVRIVNQNQILKSLQNRLDNVLSDIQGRILAEIEDNELNVAKKLIKISLRGAGAIAGVVLEGHLQRVAKNHQITIGTKTPSIANLNDPLQNTGIYDLPTWRKIQHLCDIRNYCDHKKEREPTESEVMELISGVNTIVKTIY